MKKLLIGLLCLAMLGMFACMPRLPNYHTQLLYIHPDMPSFSFFVQGFYEDDGFRVLTLSVSDRDGYFRFFDLRQLDLISLHGERFPILKDINQDGYMDLILGDFIYLWDSEQHDFLRTELLAS